MAAAIVGMAIGVAAADAAEPAATGWWWAGRPSAMIPAPLSPVPPVPEGGLYVAGDPTGPTGISALRFELAPDASATTLTLTIAETAGTPIIQACAVTEAWEPAENGGWEQRPEPDCEALSIAGTVNTDTTEVAFPLLELQDHGGVLDLVLMPGLDPGTQRSATFSVAFEPPGVDALVQSERADTDTSGPPLTSVPPGDWTFQESPPFIVRGPLPAPSPRFEAPAESETAAPRSQLASAFPGTEDFAYPAVLALPLVLLAGGSYLAWTLTRPVVVRTNPDRERAWA